MHGGSMLRLALSKENQSASSGLGRSALLSLGRTWLLFSWLIAECLLCLWKMLYPIAERQDLPAETAQNRLVVPGNILVLIIGSVRSFSQAGSGACRSACL
jgi:hypothetical protein